MIVPENNSFLETSCRDEGLSPIDESSSAFNSVARVLCAGLPGFMFHCILARQECPQLTRALATLSRGPGNLFQQIGGPLVVRVYRPDTGQGDCGCVGTADRGVGLRLEGRRRCDLNRAPSALAPLIEAPCPDKTEPRPAYLIATIWY